VAEKKEPRIKLTLPVELAEWIDRELTFLGVGTRIVLVEENHIMRKSDFLRIIINNWILRTLEVGIPDEPLETEETDRGNAYVPFYLDDRVSRGLWESAIRNGLGSSYNQLANRAFTSYWDRQVSLAQGVQQQLVLLQTAIVQHPRKSLSQVIREVLNVA
jgi:hypothetical protein